MDDSQQIDILAKTLWDYHHVNHDLIPADCILVLGNHDRGVADYAVSLYKSGLAPWIVFSGGVKNPLLKSNPHEIEANVFAARAIEQGVPKNCILIEDRATNTGENYQFTEGLLKERGLHFSTFIVVQKPYMERRTLATGQVQWPDKRLIVTSPPVSYEQYVSSEIPKAQVIDFMVGDLQRIKVYGDNGFQSKQPIPQDVWEAYRSLKNLGYTKRLLNDAPPESGNPNE